MLAAIELIKKEIYVYELLPVEFELTVVWVVYALWI